jgi:hypothetical protein
VVQSQPGANSSRDPILKKGLVEWLKCRPWVQTPVLHKKKKASIVICISDKLHIQSTENGLK